MRVVHSLDEFRQLRAKVGPVAFVPTMGNLHDGHLSLVRLARAHAKHVVVSIFVNRLQFAPTDDFDRYPRTLKADCEALEKEGVDIVFAPHEKTLYPDEQTFFVQPPAIADALEGAFRPGFFRGVATIVLKLFGCVQPGVAVFGRKDYQQLVIVRNMIRDFNLPILLIEGPTVREADGLAMSSRNSYLSEAERREAPRLYREIKTIKEAINASERDFASLCETVAGRLVHNGWKPDYISVCSRTELGKSLEGDELIVLAAARLGTTRLIDNVEV